MNDRASEIEINVGNLGNPDLSLQNSNGLESEHLSSEIPTTVSNERNPPIRKIGYCFWLTRCGFLWGLLIFIAAFIWFWIWSTDEITKSSGNYTIIRRPKGQSSDETVGLSFDGTNAFPGFDVDDTRLNEILDSFFGENTYYSSDVNARYFMFEKRATSSEAAQICAHQNSKLLVTDSLKEEKSVNDFTKKALDALIQQRNASEPEISSKLVVLTGGFYNFSSDDPSSLRWNGHNPKELYDNFCNHTRTMIEIEVVRRLSEYRISNQPTLFGLFKDFRPDQKNPGCWITLPLNGKQTDNKRFFICKAMIDHVYDYYDSDPRYLFQRYSVASRMFYKFFASKQTYHDAQQICSDEGSRLISFNSKEDEKDFDNRVKKNANKLFDEPLEGKYRTGDVAAKTPTRVMVTSGWYLPKTNRTHWGRNNPNVDTKSNYTNYCPGEIQEAQKTWQTQQTKMFAIVKRYSGNATNLNDSCWLLRPKDEVEDHASKYFFACQWKKVQFT